MPDASGKLSQEEGQKAHAWLRENWKNWACPFSGHTEWGISEYLTQTSAFAGGALVVGGPVYPLLLVTCKGCGYTVFINAIRAGIIQAPVTAAKESKDAKP